MAKGAKNNTYWEIEGGKIPDDLRLYMQERIENSKTYDLTKDLPPPWEEYPDIRYGSIGWSMGSGEDFMVQFRLWYRGLSEVDQLEYRRVNKQPESWKGFFERIIK